MSQRMVTLTNPKLKGKDGKPAVQDFVEESVEAWKRRGWTEVSGKEEKEEGAERVPSSDSKPVQQQPAANAPSKNQS